MPTRRPAGRPRYVLCWLQQAIRATDNPIIDAAVRRGNETGLPVVVYHGLDNRYPDASHRLHRFILQASRSLESGLRKRRLRFGRYVRRPDHRLPNLVYRLVEDASEVFTDDLATFVARRQADSVSAKIDKPLHRINAACLVPPDRFSSPLATTREFRAAHKALRDEYDTAVDVDVEPTVRKFTGKLPFEHDVLPHDDAGLDDLIGRCGVDMTLPPAEPLFPHPGFDNEPGFDGDRTVGLRQLAFAIEHVIPRYKWTRNNASLVDSASRLSPWIHFGVLGVREIVRAIDAADLHAAARWKFFDELLTWREYYHHRAFHRVGGLGAASYDHLPAWSRRTMDDHRDDPREVIYSLDDLIHARTDDPTWNAAQMQFLVDGWMHNNLRMYWVKQFLRWRPSPEDAYATACYFNDRLSLDGRDASTYGGIQWGFGDAKRGYRELPIYGSVPPKSDTAIRKRKGMSEWIDRMNHRERPTLEVPEVPPMRRYVPR